MRLTFFFFYYKSITKTLKRYYLFTFFIQLLVVHSIRGGTFVFYFSKLVDLLLRFTDEGSDGCRREGRPASKPLLRTWKRNISRDDQLNKSVEKERINLFFLVCPLYVDVCHICSPSFEGGSVKSLTSTQSGTTRWGSSRSPKGAGSRFPSREDDVLCDFFRRFLLRRKPRGFGRDGDFHPRPLDSCCPG